MIHNPGRLSCFPVTPFKMTLFHSSMRPNDNADMVEPNAPPFFQILVFLEFLIPASSDQ